MSFSKQLTQLGLLGTFTLVGLSACTTWHGYQTVQNPCGPSPQTVVTATPPVTAAPPVTASPPITEAAPSTPPITPAVTPPPPEETSSATTPSVPGSQGKAPASGLPSGTDKPAGVVPPPPAPPAAASAGPGTSATTSAQAAESNRDQLQTQKPLDTTTSAPEVAGQPVAANAASPPGANVMVTIPAASKAPPANQPPGPLAKLRARFHNWIQPAPKSTAKALKVAKPSGPATAPKGTPQVVASVHIPLPLSDPNRVVQEDSRAAHTIAPAEEPSPVSTAARETLNRDPRPRLPSDSRSDKLLSSAREPSHRRHTKSKRGHSARRRPRARTKCRTRGRPKTSIRSPSKNTRRRLSARTRRILCPHSIGLLQANNRRTLRRTHLQHNR